MLVKEIDRQLIQTLREVVRGREDYVYQSPINLGLCVYRASKDRPSCGIGHVADRLGLPVQEGALAGDLAVQRWGASEEVAHALDAFQANQDHQKPWGEALQRAEAVLVKYRVVI